MTLRKINTFFYFGLILFFLIFLLPGTYKMGVYTPNYLGWFMILLAGLSLLTYFFLLVVDFKKKNFKRLGIRTLFLLTIIAATVAYKFYRLYTLGLL